MPARGELGEDMGDFREILGNDLPRQGSVAVTRKG